MMKKSIIFLMICVLLCGCQKPSGNPSPTPSTATQPTMTNTPAVEQTPIPTATPKATEMPTMTPTMLPTATPEVSYQPIQVTHEPVKTNEPTLSPTSAPINHAPTLDLSEWGETVIELKENETIGFTKRIKANDEDKDSLIYSIAKAAGSEALQTFDSPYATISVARDGTVSYTLKESISSLSKDEKVVDFFMIRVSDGFNHAEALITVNIIGSNSAPVLTQETVHPVLSIPNTGEKSAHGKLMITDPDRDSLEAIGQWKIEEMIYSISEGVLVSEIEGQWRFTLAQNGSYSLTVYPLCTSGTISISVIYEDNYQLSASFSLLFTINENQSPIVDVQEKYYPIVKSLSTSAVVQDTISVTDPDADLLNYTWITQPEETHYGTFILNPDGTFSYTVNADVLNNHDDLYLIEITDGKYTVSQKLHFQITVESVDDGNETSINSDSNTNMDETDSQSQSDLVIE